MKCISVWGPSLGQLVHISINRSEGTSFSSFVISNADIFLEVRIFHHSYTIQCMEVFFYRKSLSHAFKKPGGERQRKMTQGCASAVCVTYGRGFRRPEKEEGEEEETKMHQMTFCTLSVCARPIVCDRAPKGCF